MTEEEITEKEIRKLIEQAIHEYEKMNDAIKSIIPIQRFIGMYLESKINH